MSIWLAKEALPEELVARVDGVSIADVGVTPASQMGIHSSYYICGQTDLDPHELQRRVLAAAVEYGLVVDGLAVVVGKAREQAPVIQYGDGPEITCDYIVGLQHAVGTGVISPGDPTYLQGMAERIPEIRDFRLLIMDSVRGERAEWYDAVTFGNMDIHCEEAQGFFIIPANHPAQMLGQPIVPPPE